MFLRSCHCAGAYARTCDKAGVVIVTSGPSATNLITGIETAYMDSVPIIAITGNVSKNLLGKDSFQEIDIIGITMPIVKHSYMVLDVRDLSKVIRDAFYIATEGRPGPVLIDIPKDIQTDSCEYSNIIPTLFKNKYAYKNKSALP